MLAISDISATSNKSGIEGVFRDHSSSAILHFRKEIITDSTILPEIMAVREGILIAEAF